MPSLKVRYTEWTPWAVPMPFGNGTILNGVLKDVFEALSYSLKYEFQMEEQKDRSFGALLPDGTYSGMLGALAREEVDIGGPFVASEQRAAVVDFTHCLEFSKRGIITGIESAHQNMFLYFKVFSWEVWFFLFLSVVFCALISILIYDVSIKGWKVNQGVLLTRYSWVFWSYLIGKDGGTKNHWTLRKLWYKHSFRILLAAWLLGPVIISLHSFQGQIISTFAVTKLRPVIADLGELKRKKKIIPVTTKGSATEICFKSNKDNADIWSRMQKHSIQHSVQNVEDILVKVERGTHVFIVDYIYALSIASNYVKSKGRCSIQVEELFACQSFIALALKKGFDQKQAERINSQLTYIIQAKLTDRWLNRVHNNYTHCTRQPSERKPLNVSDIAGGFVLWAIGITTAILMIIIEIITFKSQRNRYH